MTIYGIVQLLCIILGVLAFITACELKYEKAEKSELVKLRGELLKLIENARDQTNSDLVKETADQLNASMATLRQFVSERTIFPMPCPACTGSNPVGSRWCRHCGKPMPPDALTSYRFFIQFDGVEPGETEQVRGSDGKFRRAKAAKPVYRLCVTTSTKGLPDLTPDEYTVLDSDTDKPALCYVYKDHNTAGLYPRFENLPVVYV